MKVLLMKSLSLLRLLPGIVLVLMGPAFGQEKPATAKVDPSGVWRWTHEENGETVKDLLTLNFDGKQVSGKYKGRVEKAIEQAKLDGNKLTFQFDVDYEGMKIVIKFDGTLKDDSVDGKVLIDANGQTQEFPWSAKRTLEEEDVVGTWKILIKTDSDRTLEPELILSKKDGKLTGIYKSKDINQEFDAKEIKVAHGKLSFQVNGEFQGTQFKVKYGGEPRGDKMAGEVEYDLGGNTGKLEFKASRN